MTITPNSVYTTNPISHTGDIYNGKGLSIYAFGDVVQEKKLPSHDSTFASLSRQPYFGTDTYKDQPICHANLARDPSPPKVIYYASSTLKVQPD